MIKHLNKRKFLPLLAFVTVASIGLSALGMRTATAETMKLAGVSKQDPAPVEGGIPDMYMGSATAPITIIEYASLTCSHCAAFHANVLPKLKTAYIDTGRVKYVFRHFVLNGPDLSASVITRCAGPARFFPMLDMFFTRQQDWITPWTKVKAPNDKPSMKEMALLAGMDKFVRPAGLSSEKVAQCLADEKIQKQIMTTRQDGLAKFDITGTPTIIINGKKFEGNHDFDTINAELKRRL